jgi:uncharacterized protein YdaT
MPWSDQDYPASMKNLTDEVRHKAIDIANALVREDKYEEGRAIAIATAQAEKWGKHRDKPVRKKGAEGSTGHAIAKGDPEVDHAIHLIPGPQGDGWIACQEKQRLAQGQDKDDVLRKAREKAKDQGVELCIHNESGKVEDEEDYS